MMPKQARLGDIAKIPADAHGCPKCPHQCQGPAIAGSPDIMVNNKPAIRVGDNGIHAVCCGPNTWVAAKGSSKVMMNSKPAHRYSDMTTHCGGVGQMNQGSDDVITGG